MSNPRESREKDARAGSYGMSQAAASGGMVAVVGVILLASWILQAEPRPAPSPRRAAPAAASVPPASILAPLVDDPAPAPAAAETGAEPTPREPAGPSSLAQRALSDAGRLAPRRGAWTAQVAAICNEDSVATLVAKSGGSDRLYLLPVTISGRSCYRVLWGTYDSRAAASAADLPASLASGDKPRALAIAAVLP